MSGEVLAPPELAVILYVPISQARPDTPPVPGMVVAELDESEQRTGILEAIGTHPLGSGGPGRRLAYLLLFAGVSDDRLRALAGAPELTRLPVFISSVPSPSDGDAVLKAVQDARLELSLNPGFSIATTSTDPDQVGDRGAARTIGRAVRLGAEAFSNLGRAVREGAEGPLDAIHDAARNSLDLIGGLTPGRRETSTFPIPDEECDEAAILAVVTIDGPAADRAVRERQRRLVAGIRSQLGAATRPVWMVGSFHGLDGARRQGGLTRVDELRTRVHGSRLADELDLSAVSRELLAELTMDRQALTRRGWTVTSTAVLFLAPETPHVGVLRNFQFEKLVAETDAVLWVGTRIDTVPGPLARTRLQFLRMHTDIAREVGDILLGLCPSSHGDAAPVDLSAEERVSSPAGDETVPPADPR